MTVYELLFVFPGSMTEDELEARQTELKTVLEGQGAGEIQFINLNKQRLAYSIGPNKFAWFIAGKCEMEGEKVNELNSVLGRFKGLMRHLVRQAVEGHERAFAFTTNTLVTKDRDRERPTRGGHRDRDQGSREVKNDMVQKPIVRPVEPIKVAPVEPVVPVETATPIVEEVKIPEPVVTPEPTVVTEPEPVVVPEQVVSEPAPIDEKPVIRKPLDMDELDKKLDDLLEQDFIPDNL